MAFVWSFSNMVILVKWTSVTVHWWIFCMWIMFFQKSAPKRAEASRNKCLAFTWTSYKQIFTLFTAMAHLIHRFISFARVWHIFYTDFYRLHGHGTFYIQISAICTGLPLFLHRLLPFARVCPFFYTDCCHLHGYGTFCTLISTVCTAVTHFETVHEHSKPQSNSS